MRTRLAILLAGSAALGGCAYGFGDYGSYGGVSVGVNSGYGYGGYDPYYGGYGYGGYGYGSPYGGYGYGGYPYGNYGYGDPYWGWYDNYYYPGTGYYVYDSYRRPHRWSDSQRRYWESRRTRAVKTVRERGGDERAVVRENWSGFDRRDRDSNDTRRSGERQRRSDDTRPR